MAALTERLPVMTTPRWVDIETQPIGIADIVHYLLASLLSDISESRVYEIGGADRASYGQVNARISDVGDDLELVTSSRFYCR